MRPLTGVVIEKGLARLESGLVIQVTKKLEFGTRILAFFDYTHNRVRGVVEEAVYKENILKDRDTTAKDIEV